MSEPNQEEQQDLSQVLEDRYVPGNHCWASAHEDGNVSEGGGLPGE